MSTGAAPIGTPTPAPLSQGARVVNTFFAPSKTFADIRRSASWWLPWLLISVFGMAFWITVDKKVTWEQVVRSEIAKSPTRAAQMEQAPPEQRERGFQMTVAGYRYMMNYGTPVLALIMLVITAAILLAAFNFGAGAELKFGQSMAIVSYASLPGILYSLLGIVALLAGSNPEGFNMRNPVASNVAAMFMDPSQNKFLYGMASALDVFTIWTIILLAMGFSRNSKVKRGSALGIIIGLYLVWKVAMSALGTLG